MRVLVVYAHPLDTSFAASAHERVLLSLRRGGHEIDDCDLYKEAFDPVLNAEDLLAYNDVSANRRHVTAYVDRLLAANALVLIYPVWNEGFPAILKGFLDRVFLPGVSFVKDRDGAIAPALLNIRKLGAVCTYGASRLATLVMGDPPRRVVKRLLRGTVGHSVRCDYLALYDMDRATSRRREVFQNHVARAFDRW
jgi:NAD(P)H dehydrogenase (quinone)